MQTSSVKGVFLVLIMFTATLSGCFGEQAKETEQQIADFQINFTSADSAILNTGEWNEFLLVGQGRAISVPNNGRLSAR